MGIVRVSISVSLDGYSSGTDVSDQHPMGEGGAAAVAQAVAADGDRDVLVMGGAETVRHALAAGVVDEVTLNLVPVLLHAGARPLDVDGYPHTELVRTALVATAQATHLTF